MKVSVKITDDGVLNAGEEETLEVRIENLSERIYNQVSILLNSDHPSLDYREVYVGRLEPSSIQDKSIMVTVPHGYGTETTQLQIQVRDPEQTMLTAEQTVQTQGKELPKFAWKVELLDGVDGKGKGNGNRIPEVGEQIVLAVEVSNIGSGAAVEPYIRLKNRSRRQLDLLEGTVELGIKRPDCTDIEECELVMDAGSSQIGEMLLDVKSLPEEGVWNLELLVGSNRTYDYNTAVLGGFSDYFQLKSVIDISSTEVFKRQEYNQPRLYSRFKTSNPSFWSCLDMSRTKVASQIF